MPLQSTKTYVHAEGLSCTFRQWRAESHCRYPHGYPLQFKLVFEGKPDANGWVVDFGAMKPIKAWLHYMFDHTWLVAEDDPGRLEFERLANLKLAQVIIVKACGCENFAQMVAAKVQEWLDQTYNKNHRAGWSPAKLVSVEVSEHEGNSAIYKL